MLKIAILTTSRADYGFLSALIKKMKKSNKLNPCLVVCGSHLSKKHGLTINEIKKDKIKIHYKINSYNEKFSTEESIKRVVQGFSEAIKKLRPDLIFLPADRYEILAAANVALVNNIPIAHYAGGQITEGAWDNSIRHAVSKISHLHFVATKNCKKRLIQMGEDASKVFICGSLGVDNIKNTKFLKKDELEKKLNFKLNSKFALVTYHAETLKNFPSKKIFTNILKALNNFKDFKIIFTSPNIDKDSKEIKNLIFRYLKRNKYRAIYKASLGRDIYLSCLKYASFVIGNSSSGIIETPSFKIPTINIDDRQKGRVFSKNIINCKSSEKKIISSINKSLSLKFSKSIKNISNPYGKGKSAEKIIRILEKANLKNLIKKKFYEIKF